MTPGRLHELPQRRHRRRARTPATSRPRASCDTCHRTSGLVAGHGLRPQRRRRRGTCATCHNGARATGKSAHPHAGRHARLRCSCHAHQRLAADSWNHTQMVVANQCASCHSGGFPPADGRTANHIPYQSLAGVAIANCDTCHKSGFTSWAPARFHANVSVSNAVRELPHRRLPARRGQAQHRHPRRRDGNCESCHKSTSELGRRQGRPQHLHRGDQLRQLPQRQHGHRQVGHAHPGGGHQLRQLPQHHRLDSRPAGTTPR